MNITIKRCALLLLTLSLLWGMSGCGGQKEQADVPTRLFTDSLGRQVEVPAEISAVAAADPATQLMVFALCPERLVGLAAAWDSSAKTYLDEKYVELPLLGRLYGGGSIDTEAIQKSGAQVILQMGEPEIGMAAALDAMQEEIGLPVVHIDVYFDGMDCAFRMLGDLLHLPAEAETLATYCKSVYDRAAYLANDTEKRSAVYLSGDSDLRVMVAGSTPAAVIDLLAVNPAALNVSDPAIGASINLTQLHDWDPDVIFFSSETLYDAVADNNDWQTLTAIQTGHYVLIPVGPANWLGFPPSVQRLLGVLWASQILYPESADYDLYSEVSDYFLMFYHCSLSHEQYDTLMHHSLME